MNENLKITDEAVKLIREQTKRIAENLIGVYQTDNTELDAKIVITKDPDTMNLIYGLTFTINGKRYEKIVEKERVVSDNLLAEWKGILYEFVSEIVKELIRPIMLKELRELGVKE